MDIDVSVSEAVSLTEGLGDLSQPNIEDYTFGTPFDSTDPDQEGWNPGLKVY